MSLERRRLRFDLAKTPSAPPADARVRPLRPEDADALAHLMLDAYRGTIDDSGETLEGARDEVTKTFADGYGAMIWDASFVDASESTLRSAVVVTKFRDEPLLAFLMTAPDAKRTGRGRHLLVTALDALRRLGHAHVSLAVTRGNTAAERLYEAMGFETFEPAPKGSA